MSKVITAMENLSFVVGEVATGLREYNGPMGITNSSWYATQLINAYSSARLQYQLLEQEYKELNKKYAKLVEKCKEAANV